MYVQLITIYGKFGRDGEDLFSRRCMKTSLKKITSKVKDFFAQK